MEKMNFTQFQEHIRNNFLHKLPISERSKISISIMPVTKANRVLTGLVVKPDDKVCAPTIYLENYYEDYKNGEDLDVIMDSIYKLWTDNINGPEDIEIDEFVNKFHDYEFIKERIIASVINKERNKELLANVPHKIFEDLAIIYKVLANISNGELATVTIQNCHLSNWTLINLEDAANVLHDVAIENTKRLLPCTIQTMDEVMIEMMNLSAAEMKTIIGEIPLEQQMFILSNPAKINGAIAMFFEDSLTEVAEKLNSSLYIMPSSIHECIAVSSDVHTPDSLKEIVTEANATAVSLEEYLSGSVYYFDKESKTLSIAVA